MARKWETEIVSCPDCNCDRLETVESFTIVAQGVGVIEIRCPDCEFEAEEVWEHSETRD